jgi:GDP/UDP-N,N'-diacetylbacillosamine 2-epimerase (hydrolysing)
VSVPRRIMSITGTRADYGLMKPVHAAIASHPALDLHLIMTGMHLLPEFATSREEVQRDAIGTLHEGSAVLEEDSGKAMAQSLGLSLVRTAGILAKIEPDIVLLQGDRGEMLAAALAAAHMNVPTVHMSGGDVSGSIDNSLRNAISKIAHFHLTTCDASTQSLIRMGEARDRIVEVGEPGLDVLREMRFTPLDELAAELDFASDRPFLLATLHPVTEEADQAATQMRTVLDALSALDVQTVFTYPNSDAGGRAMRDVLESWRGRRFLRIVPTLGSQKYLSLMKHAAVLVGNSSSGLHEAPSFPVPAVNIGARQQSRLRATNVIDVDFDANAIAAALLRAIADPDFRLELAGCRNPYGDGHAAERTLDILLRLQLGPALVAKWRPGPADLLAPQRHGV